MKRDIISILDVEDEIDEIIDYAIKNKNVKTDLLKGKNFALIFEKQSTRTRVSFEVAINQMGGNSIYITPSNSQLGRGENIEDTAKVLSRFADGIIYRTYSNKDLIKMANNAEIPVINALDDKEHPCQILADLMTIKEKKGILSGLKLAYVGDGNNVANSLMLGAALTKMNFAIATPKGYEPSQDIIENAKRIANDNSTELIITDDPIESVKDADIIYTDVWISMGDENETEKRKNVFKNYQINQELVKYAKKDYIFMHCLPAHRNLEVTSEIIDGKHSVVFDEAENRLHAQKALLNKIFK